MAPVAELRSPPGNFPPSLEIVNMKSIRGHPGIQGHPGNVRLEIGEGAGPSATGRGHGRQGGWEARRLSRNCGTHATFNGSAKGARMTGQKASTAYSATARALHWITAALVLFMLPLGVVITNEWGGPLQDPLYDLHRSIGRSEEHTSELQSQSNLVCRLLLEKKKKNKEKEINYKKKKIK